MTNKQAVSRSEASGRLVLKASGIFCASGSGQGGLTVWRGNILTWPLFSTLSPAPAPLRNLFTAAPGGLLERAPASCAPAEGGMLAAGAGMQAARGRGGRDGLRPPRGMRPQPETLSPLRAPLSVASHVISAYRVSGLHAGHRRHPVQTQPGGRERRCITDEGSLTPGDY